MSMDHLAYNRSPRSVDNEIPIFMEPDDYSDNYDQIAGDHFLAIQHGLSNPFIEERMWKRMEASTIKLLRKHASLGRNVLDVGVGLGRLLSQIPEFLRFGTDVSEKYLYEAKCHGIEVCRARAEDLPYKDEYFDVVLCTDVLEHVFDLNEAIGSILRVLKRNGILIIRVPDREDLTPYLMPEYPYRYAHLRSFDLSGLRLLFCRIFRCEFVESEYVFEQHDVKMKIALPQRLKGVVTIALKRITQWSPTLYQWIANTLYHPLEINVVFRKT